MAATPVNRQWRLKSRPTGLIRPDNFSVAVWVRFIALFGTEVMKPLATPVLGGMVRTLFHVLIVTPVIFTWLRERELSRMEAPPAA